MTASSEGLSLPANSRTFLHISTADGNHFEMPAVPDINVLNFMAGIKAAGFLGCQNWFVQYEYIVWVTKVVYRDDMPAAVSVEGMVKQ